MQAMPYQGEGLEKAAKKLRLLHESMSREADGFLHSCLDVLENALVLREDADFVAVACVAIEDVYSVVNVTKLPMGHLLSPLALTELLISHADCAWEGSFRRLRWATTLLSLVPIVPAESHHYIIKNQPAGASYSSIDLESPSWKCSLQLVQLACIFRR